MKRLNKPQAESAAAAELRRLVCLYGVNNLNRLTLAMRRQARAMIERAKK